MKYLSITLIVCLGVLAFSCSGPSAEMQDAVRVEDQQSHYGATQPPPFFDYSLERDVVIQLYQARQQKVATHTVWRSDTGILEGDCPSIGYPIPYDTSITNPQTPFRYGSTYSSGVTVEQAEPNGLFASKNSIATWVRCVYEVQGKSVEAPIYIEGKVTAFPFPVVADYTTGRVVPAGDATPSITIEYSK